MKKQITIIQIIIPLVIGALIYIFFGTGTYINEFVGLKEITLSGFTLFLRNYFADFLWCYAFCNTLFLIYNSNTKVIFCCGIASFGLGITWELLQLFGVVSGTFDIIDCICYFSATIFAVLIEIVIKRGKQNEKSN